MLILCLHHTVYPIVASPSVTGPLSVYRIGQGFLKSATRWIGYAVEMLKQKRDGKEHTVDDKNNSCVEHSHIYFFFLITRTM